MLPSCSGFSSSSRLTQTYSSTPAYPRGVGGGPEAFVHGGNCSRRTDRVGFEPPVVGPDFASLCHNPQRCQSSGSHVAPIA